MSRDVREIVRDEHAMRAPILAALGGGPLTIPEIAVAIGAPADEAMYWVMGLRKYGRVIEDGDEEGGWFRYRAVEKAS
jgi:predicted Rossmann fold nucleotide-binding protein DprA/Smf involved in DNA uptake